MKFTMTIDCDNAAFEEPFLAEELDSILASVAIKIINMDWHPGHSKTIFDSNGNDVGRWRIGE